LGGGLLALAYSAGVTDEGRTYGGRTAAERGAERRARLVEAGIEVFARGASQVTVEEICAEASLTKRYYYEEFASLDALAEEVMAEVLRRVTPAAPQPVGNMPVEEWARMRLAEFTERLGRDPRLARLALVETFGAEGALGMFRSGFVQAAVETLLNEMLAGDYGEESDRERRAMTAHALVGASAELYVAWLAGQVEVDADAVVDYLADLYVAAAGLVGRAGGA